MSPGFFGLSFTVREQLIDLFRQRPDFSREVIADPGLFARADRCDFVTHAPQGPEAIKGLERCKDEHSHSKGAEAPDERGAKAVDLLIDRFARLGDLKSPSHRRSRQYCIALGNAQRLRTVVS